MSERPLIGILYDDKQLLNNSVLYFKHYKQNANIFSFTLDDINWNNNTIQGYFYVKKQWLKADFPFPDILYNRHYFNNAIDINRLRKIFGSKKFFNTANRLNKWQVHEALERSNLPQFLPKTYLYVNIDLIEILKNYGTLFLKPYYGHLGKNIYRIENAIRDKYRIYYNNSFSFREFSGEKEFISALERQVAPKEYIVQEEITPLEIEDHKTFDVRVLVQKNMEGQWDISAMLSRVSSPNYFITNFYSHICCIEELIEKIPFNTNRLITEIKSVSLHSAEAIEKSLGHFGELSVDFQISEQGLLKIVEINGMPDKELFSKLQNPYLVEKIYSIPIDYACYLAKL
jgi:hypothetical protein